MSFTPPPPPPPASWGQPAYGPPPEQPSSVRLAVRLMLVGAGLALVSFVIGLARLGGTRERVTDQLRDRNPDVAQSQIDLIYTSTIVGVLVGGLVVIGLWLWMAWKNGQGRQWARVLATVFGGLALVSLPFSIYSAGSEPVSLAFAVVNTVLNVVILVLLWRGSSSAYYAEVGRRR